MQVRAFIHGDYVLFDTGSNLIPMHVPSTEHEESKLRRRAVRVAAIESCLFACSISEAKDDYGIDIVHHHPDYVFEV